MTNTSAPNKSWIIAAFAAIYIIWGSTYLGILLAIKSIPPFMMASSRFIIAGGLLLLWCRFKGEKLPPLKSTVKIAFSGLLMLFVGNGAVTWVEQYIPSGLAAIIVATVPLWFVVLDRREWSYNFTNKGIIFGLLIGFAGVILLFSGKASAAIFNDPLKTIAVGVLMLGTLGWTIGSLFAKYQKMQGSTIMKVGIQMLASGIAFAITALLWSEQKGFSINDVTASSLWALAYLIIFGSLVGYLAYMWLLSVRPASLVGTYAYVNPVVAVFLGWLIASEAVNVRQGLGLGVVILGLVMVNLAKDKVASKEKSEQNNTTLNNEKVDLTTNH